MVQKSNQQFTAPRLELRWTAFFVAILTFSIGSATPAQASSVSGVTVTTVLTTAGGTVYLTHAGTRTGIPSCGSTFTNRFAFNASTPAGQALLSTLLTAYAMQKTVGFVGAGACTTTTDTEDLNYINVGP